MKTNTEQFLEGYLNSLGIKDYQTSTFQDSLGYVITVTMKKSNGKLIGILKGKGGLNLLLLKKMMRVVGYVEKISPFLIIKIVE